MLLKVLCLTLLATSIHCSSSYGDRIAKSIQEDPKQVEETNDSKQAKSFRYSNTKEPHKTEIKSSELEPGRKTSKEEEDNNQNNPTKNENSQQKPKIRRIIVTARRKSKPLSPSVEKTRDLFQSQAPSKQISPSLIPSSKSSSDEPLPSPEAYGMNVYVDSQPAPSQHPRGMYSPASKFSSQVLRLGEDAPRKEDDISHTILDSTKMIIEKANLNSKTHMSWKGDEATSPKKQRFDVKPFQILSDRSHVLNNVERMDSTHQESTVIPTFYPNLGFGVNSPRFHTKKQSHRANNPFNSNHRFSYSKPYEPKSRNRSPTKLLRIQRGPPPSGDSRSVLEVHPSVINTLQRQPRPQRPHYPFRVAPPREYRVKSRLRPLQSFLPSFMRKRKFTTMHKMKPPPPPGSHFSIVQSSLKNDKVVHRIPYRSLHFPNQISHIMKPLSKPELLPKPSAYRKPIFVRPKWMDEMEKSSPRNSRPRHRVPPSNQRSHNVEHSQRHKKSTGAPKFQTTAIVRHIGQKPRAAKQKSRRKDGKSNLRTVKYSIISSQKDDHQAASSSHFSVIQQKKPIEYLIHKDDPGMFDLFNKNKKYTDMEESNSIIHPSFVAKIKNYGSTSQPLPKEIIYRPNKLPESHASMLKNLRYGVNGEPLDVWIPLMSPDDDRRIGRSQSVFKGSESTVDSKVNEIDSADDSSQPLIFKEKQNLFKTIEKSFSKNKQGGSKKLHPSFVSKASLVYRDESL